MDVLLRGLEAESDEALGGVGAADSRNGSSVRSAPRSPVGPRRPGPSGPAGGRCRTAPAGTPGADRLADRAQPVVAVVAPPRLSRTEPNGMSSSSCTTISRSTGILKKLIRPATGPPDSFMFDSGVATTAWGSPGGQHAQAQGAA